MLTMHFGFPALAAVSCLRALAAFGFPLFATPMYNKLGHGKGDTILACVCIALGCPAYVFFLPLRREPTKLYPQTLLVVEVRKTDTDEQQVRAQGAPAVSSRRARKTTNDDLSALETPFKP